MLFTNGPHLATGTFEIGSPRLNEETAHNVDLSLRHSEGPWTWAVNLLVNGVSAFNFQEFTDLDGDRQAGLVDEEGLPGGAFLRVHFQQADALLYGAEAETRLEILNARRGPIRPS